MTFRNSVRLVTLAALLVAAAAAHAAEPATRPATTRPRVDSGAARAAMQAAISELSKEFQSSLRRSGSPARTKSDYFTDNPSEAVTPEAVATALSRSSDGDPRLAAYVKWQLLSALPEKVEEPKIAAALVRAYKTAPPPMPRPGVAPRERSQLDKLVQGARETDRQKVTEQFEKLTEQSDVSNGPILAYRDELLRRLPPSNETFAAAFADAVQRLDAGLDVADHTETIAQSVREWAMSGNATPQQLNDMLKAVRQLKGKEGPDYYDAVNWDEKARRLEWSKRHNDMNDGKHLDDLVAFLTEQVKNPPGSLKYGK